MATIEELREFYRKFGAEVRRFEEINGFEDFRNLPVDRQDQIINIIKTERISGVKEKFYDKTLSKLNARQRRTLGPGLPRSRADWDNLNPNQQDRIIRAVSEGRPLRPARPGSWRERASEAIGRWSQGKKKDIKTVYEEGPAGDFTPTREEGKPTTRRGKLGMGALRPAAEAARYAGRGTRKAKFGHDKTTEAGKTKGKIKETKHAEKRVKGSAKDGYWIKPLETHRFAKFQLKSRPIEIGIAWILGLIAATIFGYMGLGLGLIFYGMYLIFPSQEQVLAEARQFSKSNYFCGHCQKSRPGNPFNPKDPINLKLYGDEGVPTCQKCHNPLTVKKSTKLVGHQEGKLLMKSMFKLIAIISVVYEFGVVHVWHELLPVVILFWAYFNMPMKYNSNEPYRSIEAWSRLIFAVLLGASMYALLTPGGGGLMLGLTSLMGFLPAISSSLVFILWLALIYVGMKSFLGEGGFARLVYILVMIFSISMFTAFVPFLTITDPAMAMFFLVLAFFFTIPTIKMVDSEGLQTRLSVLVNASDPGAVRKAVKAVATYGTGPLVKAFSVAMFYGFSAFAALPIVYTWTEGSESLGIILGVIWLVSILVGGMEGGRETRPYLGVMLIIFSMIAFSFQYTGTVGTAIFGQWWPMIYSVTSQVTEPITESMASVQAQLADYQLMVTCYDCWVAKQDRARLVDIGKVKEGGTTRSLTLSGFQALNYETREPNLDPLIPLVGEITLENRGEFIADDVLVELGHHTPACKSGPCITVTNPQEVSIADPEKGVKYLVNDKCEFTYCPDTTPHDITAPGYPISACKWSKEKENQLQPGDKRTLSFQCGAPTEDYEKWSDDLKLCKCTYCQLLSNETGFCEDYKNKPDTDCSDENLTTCISTEGVDGQAGIYTYNMSHFLTKIPMTYKFNYHVNSSIDIDVVNEEFFREQNLKPEGVESQYSGGPAKLNVWTQNQPLRDGQLSYGKVILTNTGSGEILNHNPTAGQETVINVTIASEGLTFEPGSLKVISEFGLECSDWEITGGTAHVGCTLKKNLAKSDSANMLFRFTYNLPAGVSEKRALMVGSLDPYTYEDTKNIELEIASAPWVQ